MLGPAGYVEWHYIALRKPTQNAFVEVARPSSADPTPSGTWRGEPAHCLPASTLTHPFQGLVAGAASGRVKPAARKPSTSGAMRLSSALKLR